MPLRTPEPVSTLELFEPLGDELVQLLRSLTIEEWSLSTSCSLWSVKDLTAHLLDTDLRRLSLHRDGHLLDAPRGAFETQQSLVAWLNQLNAQWTTASERLSPTVLIALLQWSNPQVQQFFAGLDPFAKAQWPVAWAGESESENWFDIAREYTEKWLHHQQIREATKRPLLDSPRFLTPVLATFVRALPHAYRSTRAARGTEIAFSMTGAAGSAWTLIADREVETGWLLLSGTAVQPAASLQLDQDTAWRFFSKGSKPPELLERIQIEGNRALAEVALESVAIMA